MLTDRAGEPGEAAISLPRCSRCTTGFQHWVCRRGCGGSVCNNLNISCNIDAAHHIKPLRKAFICSFIYSYCLETHHGKLFATFINFVMDQAHGRTCTASHRKQHQKANQEIIIAPDMYTPRAWLVLNSKAIALLLNMHFMEFVLDHCRRIAILGTSWTITDYIHT